MNTDWRFPIMIAASLVEFILLLRLVLGGAMFRRRRVVVLVVAFIVVVVGMMFGKYGLLFGLPWWIYYPVPALVTVVLPPLAFTMTTKRTMVYLGLAAVSAPLIHVLFAFFLGWHEYMPFITIPSLGSLLSR